MKHTPLFKTHLFKAEEYQLLLDEKKFREASFDKQKEAYSTGLKISFLLDHVDSQLIYSNHSKVFGIVSCVEYQSSQSNDYKPSLEEAVLNCGFAFATPNQKKQLITIADSIFSITYSEEKYCTKREQLAKMYAIGGAVNWKDITKMKQPTMSHIVANPLSEQEVQSIECVYAPMSSNDATDSGTHQDHSNHDNTEITHQDDQADGGLNTEVTMAQRRQMISYKDQPPNSPFVQHSTFKKMSCIGYSDHTNKPELAMIFLSQDVKNEPKDYQSAILKNVTHEFYGWLLLGIPIIVAITTLLCVIVFFVLTALVGTIFPPIIIVSICATVILLVIAYKMISLHVLRQGLKHHTWLPCDTVYTKLRRYFQKNNLSNEVYDKDIKRLTNKGVLDNNGDFISLELMVKYYENSDLSAAQDPIILPDVID